MDYLIAVTFFAVSASVTPGPNNIMVMTSGLNFGIKRSLPLLTGICIGFPVMLLLVGLGMGQLFVLYPSLFLIIKCLGTLYLLYLAWLIAQPGGKVGTGSQVKPLSFVNGALFQWINAKAWVVATGAVAAFTTSGGASDEYYTIALTFLLVSFPCVGLWLVFGSTLKTVLNNDQKRRWFNAAMALLLVLSVLPVVQDIVAEFR